MAIRRQHTDTEIAALAEQFRQSWSEGRIVRSWLRAHGDELTQLVRHDDWAWVNLGRALTLAGIAYRTGNPWTGENLRRAVALAKKPLKREQKRKMALASEDSSVDPAGGTNGDVVPEQSPPRKQTEPEFRIIRKTPAPGSDPLPATRLAPAPQHAIDRSDLSDDEVLTIAAGRALKR